MKALFNGQEVMKATLFLSICLFAAGTRSVFAAHDAKDQTNLSRQQHCSKEKARQDARKFRFYFMEYRLLESELGA